MKTDFIKWMVGYAEGFECKGDQICNPANFMYTLSNFDADYKKDLWKFTDYPLLLQRAIEGVNKSSGLSIKQHNTIIVWNGYYCKKIFHANPIDQAKEQALKYIYEQEKNNGN